MMVFAKPLVVSLGALASATLALDPTDPVLVGQTFLAGSMDPTAGSAPWALTSHGVAEKLFTVDKHGEIVPQVAESVTKVSDDVWEITLKEGYRFSDGTLVDASHVAYCLTDLNLKNPNAQSSLGDIAVTAEGELTVKIRTERPTHVMDAVLAEWVFVIYNKVNDSFVYTGPYAIESFDSDQIELVPNRYYDEKSLERPKITLQKFADGHALAERMLTGEIDIGFHLPIDTLGDIRKVDDVRVKSFEVGYHYMMFHNTDNGKPLADVKVRKAIDLAIDRTALSQSLAGGTATRSLFPDYSPYYYDESDPHGDSDGAEALLEEAGWILNDDGKREKDGSILKLNLVAYPHRPGLVIMQPAIQESLETLGITVESILTGFNWSETSTIISERTFDLLLWAQHTLPAGDPLWFLSAFFRSDGANNHAGIASDNIDDMLDDLSETEDHVKRVALTADVHSTILSEVPVSNLVTPFWHVGLSDRMADYEPWGSDYYIIRPDLFVTEVATKGDPDIAEAVEDSAGARSGSKSMVFFLVAMAINMVA